jgi:23S rRNA pseudouridine1911/1915/1917 synthase
MHAADGTPEKANAESDEVQLAVAERRAALARTLGATNGEDADFVIGEPGSEPGGAIQVDLKVKRPMDGKRLDQYLVDRFPAYSRNIIQKIIVNAHDVKPSYQVKRGDHIRIWLPELNDEPPEPEPIPLDIIYEDDFFIVVNKPAGMVVHPAKGHWRGTLVNALQFHFDELSKIAGPHRPGIVHRLDRDTSGLIVVAKDDLAHANLAAQFERRSVRKEYVAITCGVLDRDSDYIERALGPHPTHREKMAIRELQDGGKEAVSYYEVAERYDGYTLVRIYPKTGRTHQIRVHLAHVGCPILADQAYGGRKSLSLGEIAKHAESEESPVVISRQALHANRLWLDHPRIRQPMEFEAPLPADFTATLEALRKFRPYRVIGH